MLDSNNDSLSDIPDEHKQVYDRYLARSRQVRGRRDEENIIKLLLDRVEGTVLGDFPSPVATLCSQNESLYVSSFIFHEARTSISRASLHDIAYLAKNGPLHYRRWLEQVLQSARDEAANHLALLAPVDGGVLNNLFQEASYDIACERIATAIGLAWGTRPRPRIERVKKVWNTYFPIAHSIVSVVLAAYLLRGV